VCVDLTAAVGSVACCVGLTQLVLWLGNYARTDVDFMCRIVAQGRCYVCVQEDGECCSGLILQMSEMCLQGMAMYVCREW